MAEFSGNQDSTVSDRSLDKTELAELKRLRQTVKKLATTNIDLVASIHTLSGELLKRQSARGSYTGSQDDLTFRKRPRITDPLFPLRYEKTVSEPSSTVTVNKSQSSSSENIELAQPNLSDKGLPPELVLHIFTYLPRSDIDQCRMVCRRWSQIINDGTTKLQRRYIRLLKIVEQQERTLTISASTHTKSLKYNINVDDGNHIDNETIKRLIYLLRYSFVKRMTICNMTLSNLWIYDLHNIFSKANVKFTKFELNAVGLDQLTHESFHSFIGEKVAARFYLFDGLFNGNKNYFNSSLYEKPNILNAEEFAVFDVTSFAGEQIVLDVADDALIDFIFGRHVKATNRHSIYLDTPGISATFVYNALVRFSQESDLSNSMTHTEFASVVSQSITPHRNITFEYSTEVQSEYSSRNYRTGHILEVKITKSDEDHLVHMTMEICPEIDMSVR